MQQRLIETCLEFVGNDEYAICVLFEHFSGLRFWKAVHIRLGVIYASVPHGSREGDQRSIGIALLFQIPIYCPFVAHGMQARAGHDHSFGFAVDQVSYLSGKVLSHNRYLFGDGLLMPVNEGFEQQDGFSTVIMGVGLDLFEETPIGFVGGVVLQHIKDEMRFYCLPHCVEAERFIFAIFAPRTEKFKCLGLSRESRYSIFLRRKNATAGTDSQAEMTSIRKSRGSLVDTRTEQSQIAIEGAIIKRA